MYFGHAHTAAFIYYVFIFGCSGSSLLHAGSLVVTGGCSLVVVHRLRIEAASIVVELGV